MGFKRKFINLLKYNFVPLTLKLHNQYCHIIRESYDQPPTQPGPTSRRNFLHPPVSKSTWNRMVREELGLRAYKVFNLKCFQATAPDWQSLNSCLLVMNIYEYNLDLIQQIGKQLQIEPGDIVRRMQFTRNYIQMMDRHPEYLWLWRCV